MRETKNSRGHVSSRATKKVDAPKIRRGKWKKRNESKRSKERRFLRKAYTGRRRKKRVKRRAVDERKT